MLPGFHTVLSNLVTVKNKLVQVTHYEPQKFSVLLLGFTSVV